MRLPWPFGRRTSPDGPPSGTAEDGGTGAGAHDTAAPGVPGSTVAPATGAWAALPPIQRTVGAPPLVAPSAPFLGDVPGHRPLPPIVEPLGHQSSPSAPAGLVVAHPRPVPSLTSHADLAPRPIQRRAASEPAPAPMGGGAEAFEAPSFTPVGGPEPEPTPVRHLASVSPAATVTPAARPLTRAPSSPAPLASPTVSRSTAAAHQAAAHAAPSAGTPSSGPSSGLAGAARTPGLVKTVSRWAEGTPTGTRPGLGAPLPPAASTGPATSGVTRTAAADAIPSTREAAPAGGRRAGLGAPIPTPPASAVAQRLPMRAPSAHAESGQPTGPEGTGPAGSPGTAAALSSIDTTPSSGPGPATRPLPVLPVSRRRRDGAAEAEAPGAVTSAARPTAAGSPGGPSASGSSVLHASPSILPLLGARPIRTGVTAQREPADTAPGTAVSGPSGAGSSSDPGPVAARWASGDDLPGTVIALPGAHGAAPAPVQLSPFPAAPGAPAPDATVPGGPREITFPPRDGLVSAAPAPSPASWASGPSAPATPGGQRLASSPAVRLPAGDTAGRPLTLARSVAPAPAREAHAPAATSASPASNRIVSSATPSPAPTVQASRSSSGPALPALTATPVVQRVEGAAPAAEPDSQGHSDTELDELARALFGRIRTHLRAEVIHEREAKGLTFDAF